MIILKNRFIIYGLMPLYIQLSFSSGDTMELDLAHYNFMAQDSFRNRSAEFLRAAEKKAKLD